MVSVAEIVQKIYEYLRGDLPLDSLRDWMVGAELQLEPAGEHHPARELVWQIEARYAELSDGVVDESFFKKLLQRTVDELRAATEARIAASVYVSPRIPNASWGGNPASNCVPEAELQLIESH